MSEIIIISLAKTMLPEHIFSLKLVSHARTFLRKDLREKIYKEAYVKKLRKRPYESLCSHVRKRPYETICLYWNTSGVLKMRNKNGDILSVF